MASFVDQLIKIIMANNDSNGNGLNGTITESKLTRWVGWASLIVAISLQAGIVINRVNSVSNDLHDAVLVIRTIQVEQASKAVELQDLERRIGNIESSVWSRSK